MAELLPPTPKFPFGALKDNSEFRSDFSSQQVAQFAKMGQIYGFVANSAE